MGTDLVGNLVGNNHETTSGKTLNSGKENSEIVNSEGMTDKIMTTGRGPREKKFKTPSWVVGCVGQVRKVKRRSENLTKLKKGKT